jgi:hypothetical protein
VSRVNRAAFFALGWIILVPREALAWGPGTHIALGEALLASLYLLPPALRSLLERYPIHFLYGSVAADISFAKKYVPEGRHCHNWHVGEEILAQADSESLQAVGYGYLAHLAADTVAHNLYVPRQLLLTSTSQALGHTYWEHRMDMHVGEIYLGKARRLVLNYGHEDADRMFNSVLSRTLFSFRTNRRLFRGMIRLQDDPRWRQVFDRVLQNSRFDVPDPLVDRYTALAFDYVVDYLNARGESRPARLDPVGEENLRRAKKERRKMETAPGIPPEQGVLEARADEIFALPDGPILYRPTRPVTAASTPRKLLG